MHIHGRSLLKLVNFQNGQWPKKNPNGLYGFIVHTFFLLAFDIVITKEVPSMCTVFVYAVCEWCTSMWLSNWVQSLTSTEMLHYGAIDYHILQKTQDFKLNENCSEVRSTGIKTKHILIRLRGKVLWLTLNRLQAVSMGGLPVTYHTSIQVQSTRL